MYLAEIDDDTTEKYAIKSIRKDRLVERDAIAQTYTELQILSNSDHPFLTNILYFFSSEVRFYFVMPFIGGGELTKVLKQAGKFTELQIKFYSV